MDSLRVQPGLCRLPSAGPIEVSNAKTRPEADVRALGDDFEALLMLHMIRSLESQLESGSLFGSERSGEVFGGFAEWEIARTISRCTDLGLRDRFLEQIQAQEAKQK